MFNLSKIGVHYSYYNGMVAPPSAFYYEGKDEIGERA
jgi:hypothetical protein